MVMSIKEATALIREAQSREDLAKAIKSGGKDYEIQRLALEKTLGGQKKLAQADAVLVKAEGAAEKVVSEAKRMAHAIVDEANAGVRHAMNEVASKEASLLSRFEIMDKDRSVLNERVAVLNANDSLMEDQATNANNREIALNTREAHVTAREAKASAREAEIAKFETWRAAVPA